MKKVVFDSYAVLKYLQQESGFEQVKELFHQAEEGNVTLYMNQINLGEVYYCIIRRKGTEYAQNFLSTFSQLPVTMVSSDELILSAAELKAQYAISYADCFAAATAIKKKAAVLTGDPEFKKVEGMVEIKWI